jgi:hypothetical protein
MVTVIVELPDTPVVSTTISLVDELVVITPDCPEVISPAEVVQLKVRDGGVSAPITFAVKVTGSPGLDKVSGQLTVIVGHRVHTTSCRVRGKTPCAPRRTGMSTPASMRKSVNEKSSADFIAVVPLLL